MRETHTHTHVPLIGLPAFEQRQASSQERTPRSRG